MRFITFLGIVAVCTVPVVASAQVLPETNASNAGGEVIPAVPAERFSTSARLQAGYAGTSGKPIEVEGAGSFNFRKAGSTITGSFAVIDGLELLGSTGAYLLDVSGTDPVLGGAHAVYGDPTFGVRYIRSLDAQGLGFGLEANAVFASTVLKRGEDIGFKPGHVGWSLRALGSWRGMTREIPIDVDANIGYFANPSAFIAQQHCEITSQDPDADPAVVDAICGDPYYPDVRTRYALGIGGPIGPNKKSLGQLLMGVGIGTELMSGRLHPRLELTAKPFLEGSKSGFQISPGVSYRLSPRTTVVGGLHFTPGAGSATYQMDHPTGGPITVFAAIQGHVFSPPPSHTIARTSFGTTGTGSNNGGGNGTDNGGGNNGTDPPDEGPDEGVKGYSVRVMDTSNDLLRAVPIKLQLPGTSDWVDGRLDESGQYILEGVKLQENAQLTILVPGYRRVIATVKGPKTIQGNAVPTEVTATVLAPSNGDANRIIKELKVAASLPNGEKQRLVTPQNISVKGNRISFSVYGLTVGIWQIEVGASGYGQRGTATVTVSWDSVAEIDNPIKLVRLRQMVRTNFNRVAGGRLDFEGRVTFEPDLPSMTGEAKKQLDGLVLFYRRNRKAMAERGWRLRVVWNRDPDGPETVKRIIGKARAVAVRDYLVSNGIPSSLIDEVPGSESGIGGPPVVIFME